MWIEWDGPGGDFVSPSEHLTRYHQTLAMLGNLGNFKIRREDLAC